jgi:hypothetical protein
MIEMYTLGVSWWRFIASFFCLVLAELTDPEELVEPAKPAEPAQVTGRYNTDSRANNYELGVDERAFDFTSRME